MAAKNPFKETRTIAEVYAVARTLRSQDIGDTKVNEMVSKRKAELLKVELLETMHQVMVYSEAAKHCRNVLRSNIVQVVIGKLYAYDIYTLEHSIRVAGYAMDLAYANGMTRKDIVRVGIEGVIHDIGKIFVDINIINKPEKLTDVEYEEVKKHVQLGVDWLKQRGIRNDILVAVSEHHEHLDGGVFIRSNGG